MKRLAIDDQRGEPEYLSGTEPLLVELNGRVVGLYFPIRSNSGDAQAALDRLGRTVDAILARTGMTEEEFIQAFDEPS